MKADIQIRLLQQKDIHPISAAFSALGWDKPVSQYEHYYEEQEAGDRVVLVAEITEVFAGYVTIVWESLYPIFWQEGIPEIVDLNVLLRYRRCGVGTRLMDDAEHRISERSHMDGIGVGMTADYGAAQIMYVKRGYIPDGRGLIQDGDPLMYGDRVTVGDGLTLYLTKNLRP